MRDNPNAIKRIVRGSGIPCHNKNKIFGDSQELSVNDLIEKTLESAIYGRQIEFRRDGLVTYDDGTRLVEWKVPQKIVKEIEEKSISTWKIPHEEANEFLVLDKNFYGVPLKDPKGLFSAPLSIQWDLTSRCNLLCRHCYASATSHGGNELSTGQALEIVNEAAKIGVHSLHFLGGDPFMRKDIVEIVSHACTLGLKCHLSTNGTLLCESQIEELRKLSGLTIDISIDSIYPEKHDWLRGFDGTFTKASKNIKLLVDAEIKTGTTCTVHPDTLSEMEGICKQAINWGMHRLQFLYVSPVGRGKDNQVELLLNETEKVVFRDQFIHLLETYSEQIAIDSPVISLESDSSCEQGINTDGLWLAGCLAGIEKMSIRSDGSVVGCPQLKQTYGNLMENSLQDVWLAIHTDRVERLGEGCLVCSFDGICGGGCPAPNEYEDEISPCFSRKSDFSNRISKLENRQEIDQLSNCPFTNPCLAPCLCPIDCPFPCNCPTHCNFPCLCPGDCPLPCNCPTHCNFPCLCPVDCPFPCSCPTHCNLPCPFPCSFPR